MNAPRFLIVRLSAIGDTILNLPIACALRDRYPDAEIGWVVSEGPSPLLADHPDIDRLFVMNKSVMKSPSKFLRLIRSIRDWHPSIAIDAQGLTKSSLIARFSGAKKRIGLVRSGFEGRELSTWLNTHLVNPSSPHVVARGLALLQPLGITDPIISYRIPPHPDDTAFTQEFLVNQSIHGPYAVINVGAGWISRIWPVERYAAVATHLWRNWSLPSIVVWAGNEEYQSARQICEVVGASCHLAPKTTLRQLGELIRNAEIFVGSDTGPMHLSVAVNTPTIAMIGPMPIERTGPIGEYHRAIQKERLSSDRLSDRKTDMRPMLSIQWQDVVEACDSVLRDRMVQNRDRKTSA